MNILYKTRNSIIHFFYVWALKPVLFLFDPEDIHNLFTKTGHFLGRFGITRWKTRMLFGYKNSRLTQEVLGIKFENPIGLSAGFDKDIMLTEIISDVGFGFEEVGSVTSRPYAGNPRPRLWRLTKSRSLGVWFGLKNQGVEVLSKKLAGKVHRLPIGVNVAFTNCKENLEISSAIPDYVAGAKVMEKYADYLTINLSCPNTSGGMPFLLPDNYEKLMVEIDKISTSKPIFVKINPDMTHAEIDKFLEISLRHRVRGIICSNLTKNYSDADKRDALPPHGGLSGKLVYPKALDLLSYMYKKARLPSPAGSANGGQVGNKFVFVFVGGVFSADDAYRAIRQGATLIQLITGMLFDGPQVIREINRGLVERMNRDGFKNISDVVGFDNKR